ncbi:MAG: AAA family ATPase [Betaproteobacteria bacterium]|nr:AAA family ATPase [Betaproteobacteria bacterium]NCA17000.1 AAA family ATPase [Betaproteobacteria bacterium]
MATISVKTLLEVAPLLPSETSVLLRGDHGIGKSQVVRQIAAGLKLQLIDRRLSQMSEGDIIGLPSTDGNVTRFNPVSWFVEACDHPRVLLLDEINRATNEVMQAAFQIVLDRELNGRRLHPETRVFAAINTGASYTVNEMDPAFLDRFWVVDLTPTVEDWITWGRGRLADVVVDFIAQNNKWLDPAKNANLADKQVSRRSWERLSKALTASGLVDNPENPLFYSVCSGFVGAPAAADFVSFAKSVEGRFTGEQIINTYSEIRPRLRKLRSQDRWNLAMEKAAEYVTTQSTLNKGQLANLRAFTQDIGAELRVALWSRLTSGGQDRLDLTKQVHGAIHDLVIESFVKKESGKKGS